jgi:hypothetical protein
VIPELRVAIEYDTMGRHGLAASKVTGTLTTRLEDVLGRVRGQLIVSAYIRPPG